ncbi:MAG: EAL domain-containing protein [Campylobacterales bacterium]|nr:EAL domain-containing protein [Campylobacterales bacterium]
MKLNLKNKLSVILISSMVILVVVLGAYFDTFLRESYFETAKQRISYAFNRINLNLSELENDLTKGVAFIKDDEAMLASVELINAYQDKNNYDTVLLDEEKKQIAEQLLHRVKLSLNDTIALYDRNEELIAYVAKTDPGYSLHFVSYENGRPLFYSRLEDENDYCRDGLVELRRIPYKHVNYYTQKELMQSAMITYHSDNDVLIVTSHQSLFVGDKTSPTAHIELSRHLGPSYFRHLSQDLNMEIAGSTHPSPQSASHLMQGPKNPVIDIVENHQNYLSSGALHTRNGAYYIAVSLERSSLSSMLNKNRSVFVMLILALTAIAVFLLRFLFNRSIARPLQALMVQVDKIKRQDYSDTVVVRTGDELETISENINQLARTIDERENALSASQKQLEHLSNTDSLTNLPNRRLFNALLEHALQIARRNHQQIAVVFLDLDNFKQINDTMGHDVGDELLKAVSLRLKSSLRGSDTLARIGGDEFNILIEGIEERTQIAPIVQKILDDFKEPFFCNGHSIRTTTSIGIALYPEDGEDIVTLTKHADLAMYKSKNIGRNAYSYFSQDLFDAIEKKTLIIHELKAAIDAKNGFYLLYQPKVSVQEPEKMAIEALIRWKSETLGPLTPDRFIPIAEESGLIIPIGQWVLEQACRDFLTLSEQGYRFDHISVNVSSIQLQKSDMIATLGNLIAATQINPTQLELEITESYIATEQQKALTTLQALRDMGIRIAIDDFGTGYSSMSYLQKLPVTRLKIDKSFVDDLPGSAESTAVAKAIIALAKTFGLSITAEGVETAEQLAFLAQEGCDEIQGYYYSKPLEIGALKTFVTSFKRKK